MSDSRKKYEEIMEAESLLPPQKAEKVMVRLGFSDQVISLADAMDNEKEICSCDSYVVGYEDEDGKECDSEGNYLDKNQTHIFFQ